MAQTSRGERVAFAVVHLETGQAIGSTAYLDIDRPNRALEIGMTWYGTAWQRTGVNTECKYLLMRHAFEDQSARRVCLKTDSRNDRSRQAILRLGAVEEASGATTASPGTEWTATPCSTASSTPSGPR